MIIKNYSFVKSSSITKNCPDAVFPEFAFIGRSNVGKSSLINMLVNSQKLAKISSKPGKTQLINHFMIDNKWYLVDLPGYGWAKVSKEEKSNWGIMIHDYLLNRKNLTLVSVLVDSRLPPQKIDIEFINWLGEKKVPFIIVFTKIDKQSKNKTNVTIKKFKNEMSKYWEVLPTIFTTSSVNNSGRIELLRFIKSLLGDN